MKKKSYIAPSFEVEYFKVESILTSTSENPGTDFDVPNMGEAGPPEF